MIIYVKGARANFGINLREQRICLLIKELSHLGKK